MQAFPTCYSKIKVLMKTVVGQKCISLLFLAIVCFLFYLYLLLPPIAVFSSLLVPVKASSRLNNCLLVFALICSGWCGVPGSCPLLAAFDESVPLLTLSILVMAQGQNIDQILSYLLLQLKGERE